LEKRKEMLDQLMLDSTNLTFKEQQQQNAPYGAFASQLLKTCTTQLLREQLTKTELFVNQRQGLKDEFKIEDYFSVLLFFNFFLIFIFSLSLLIF